MCFTPTYLQIRFTATECHLHSLAARNTNKKSTFTSHNADSKVTHNLNVASSCSYYCYAFQIMHLYAQYRHGITVHPASIHLHRQIHSPLEYKSRFYRNQLAYLFRTMSVARRRVTSLLLSLTFGSFSIESSSMR